MSYLSDYLGESYKEGMTEDELSAVLEEVNKKNMSNALTKANSEAASYKKKMKEAMDNVSAASTENEKLNQRLAELERDNAISKRKAQFLANGFSDEQSGKMAEAYADNDMDKILEIQSAFLADKEKAIKADLLKSTPKPEIGNSGAPEKPETNIAEMLGKMRADKNKQSQDIINMYTNRGE